MNLFLMFLVDYYVLGGAGKIAKQIKQEMPIQHKNSFALR
jgi:hypothetical protein